MQKMSDSKRRHHHHHHHSYDGPRSEQAEGLSEEYMTTLSDDMFKKALSEDSESLEEDQAFSDEINRSIEEQLEIHEENEKKDRENRESGRKKKKRRKHADSFTRGQRRSRLLIRILVGIVVILLALILAFLLLRYWGERNLKKNIVETTVVVPEIVEEEVVEEDDDNLLIYNGERYWYNEDIITVLCIGVDREEFVTSDEMVIGGNGQADADVLVIFDKKQGKMSFLNISRDCMVDVDRYNIKGQFIDTVKEQLCLSFAFGNGKQTSCENTALSVSRLLSGMPINAYVAIDFESIAALNDAVGGVTVPITEEIAEKFPGLQVGSQVTLVGSEAVTYIRSRDTSVLDSNNARMSRQKQYVIAFLRKALEQIKADPTKAVSLFSSVSDNMVTSIKLSEVTYFGSFFAKYGFNEENLLSVQGQVIEGEDGYAQFIPDEKALFETVLDLFYIKE